MLEFKNSKSGLLTAVFNNRYIHSSVNPLLEAERYISSRPLSEITPTVVLLIFPGLNYIYSFVKKKYPGVPVAVIHINYDFYANSAAALEEGDYSWFPGCGTSLRGFLYDSVLESDMRSLSTFTWDYTIKSFPDDAKKISSVIEQVLREFNSNISTTSFFGKRYIKNIVRNLADLRSVAMPEKVERPVVIAGSGPTLSESLNFLQNARADYFLISLSSSFQTLLSYNIVPDIVVSTDPGYYASLHLNRARSTAPVLASPLTGYTPGINQSPRLVINQGTVMEKLFLKKTGIPDIAINPNGTVAGSAVFLASMLTSFPVILAGIDFCTGDIYTHCRPHAFDYLYTGKCGRIKTSLSLFYENSRTNYRLTDITTGARTSGALETYAAWFDSVTFGNNVFRLNPAAVRIRNIPEITNNDAYRIVASCRPSRTNKFKIRIIHDFVKHIENVISCLKSVDKHLSDTIKNPLKYTEPGFMRKYFDSDILYYFDTDTYLKVLMKINQTSSNGIEELITLAVNCRYFLDKEIGKLENYRSLSVE